MITKYSKYGIDLLFGEGLLTHNPNECERMKIDFYRAYRVLIWVKHEYHWYITKWDNQVDAKMALRKTYNREHFLEVLTNNI